MAGVLRPEQLQALARKRLGLQQEAARDKSRLEQDFGLSRSNILEQAETQRVNTGDQLASQGIYNSGIRIDAQGNITKQANQAVSDLNLQKSRGLSDIATNLSKGLAGLDAEHASALAAANRELQEANDRRAMLEATRQAAMVRPPAYPSPIISMPGGGAGARPAAPGNSKQTMMLDAIAKAIAQNTGDVYQSWKGFEVANPQLAGLYMLLSSGDLNRATQTAMNAGYLHKAQPARPGGFF